MATPATALTTGPAGSPGRRATATTSVFSHTGRRTGHTSNSTFRSNPVTAVPVVELAIWPTALAGHEHLAAVVIGTIAALRCCGPGPARCGPAAWLRQAEAPRGWMIPARRRAPAARTSQLGRRWCPCRPGT